MKNRIKEGLSTVSTHLSACMVPLIPLIMAGSLLKLLCLIGGMSGILSGQTLTILQTVGDTPFYFLPVLAAVTASEHFGANLFYSLGIACMFLMPDLVSMMSGSDEIAFGHIPVIRANYAYNILPVILMTWLLAKTEPFAERKFPQMLKGTVYPLLVFLTASICALLVVGPIGAVIGAAISKVLLFLSGRYGILAWPLLAFLIPVLVPTGMHWLLVTAAITQIGAAGVESGIMAGFFIVNMAFAGADLALALCTRDSQRRGQAVSAGLTVLVAGVSEPSIFGICLNEKKMMGCVMAASALTGLYQGVVGIHCFVYSAPGLFAILMFHNPEDVGNVWKAIGAAVIAIVLAFGFTFFVCRERDKKPENS